MDGNLWNCEPKQTFPSFNFIVSDIHHSDGKLTKTPPQIHLKSWLLGKLLEIYVTEDTENRKPVLFTFVFPDAYRRGTFIPAFHFYHLRICLSHLCVLFQYNPTHDWLFFLLWQFCSYNTSMRNILWLFHLFFLFPSHLLLSRFSLYPNVYIPSVFLFLALRLSLSSLGWLKVFNIVCNFLQ